MAPFLKNLTVGQPLTSYFSESSVSSVASTLAKIISEDWDLRAVAAFMYSGAKALQWPHQGASDKESKTKSVLRKKEKEER